MQEGLVGQLPVLLEANSEMVPVVSREIAQCVLQLFQSIPLEH